MIGANGGFHEALTLQGTSLNKPKRMRTMARQVYAFSVAKLIGWDGPADRIVPDGIDFMLGGRTARGGWARTLDVDGRVADPCEDAYDHACVLLALAYAHQAGHPDARRLGLETFAYLDDCLEDCRLSGFQETAEGGQVRRTNPHMHLLEAFLAWHAATGERAYLRRASSVVDLFRSRFFDPATWTVGEYFDDNRGRPPATRASGRSRGTISSGPPCSSSSAARAASPISSPSRASSTRRPPATASTV